MSGGDDHDFDYVSPGPREDRMLGQPHGRDAPPLLERLRDSRYIGQEGMRAEAAAEIERLLAALKPFAEAGKTLLDEPDETGVIIKDPITVGDFRRAACAYEQKQG